MTAYVVPTSDADASWASEHGSGYPAVDIFVHGTDGCGGDVLSPVDGLIVEVRRENEWDESIDNPATRGGRTVTIIGDDGVRYYLAHFFSIDGWATPGARTTAGQHLGIVGTTGRSSACHIHFGMSPPCPGQEWKVRRGAIGPWPYVDDWRVGGQLSPVAEIAQWVADHPDACQDAMAEPTAADS